MTKKEPPTLAKILSEFGVAVGPNPDWFLEKLGIAADSETRELLVVLVHRYGQAPDKYEFVKDCLRKALDRKPG